MAELSPGDELAGYRIEAVAGRGGMGVVYRATDTALERKVAIKLISDELAKDDSFRERFKRESRLAASIRHPNVITVFRAGEEDGHLFIAMDYIEGTDLKELIAGDGRLEPAAAARIVLQVGEALDAAHAKTLVHRDVKPANVLIAREGGGARAYLTDFGLTKNIGSETGMTKTGVVVGTIDYMAPEQMQGGPIDARVDIYSLGCVLWEALTAQVPYPRDSTVAKMYAHAHDDPPSLSEAAPGLPAALGQVVSRAMAKQPEERYLSAGDLGRAALAAAEGREIDMTERSVAMGAAALRTGPDDAATAVRPRAAPPSPTDAAAPPPRRRGRWVAAAAAGLAALALALVLLLGGGGDDGGSSGTPALSKDAYQDAVIDSSQGFTSTFVDVGPKMPETLNDPAKAQEAARDLTTLRNSADSFIAKLKAIDAPADIAPVHAQLIALVGKLRSDIADGVAAASFGDEKAYRTVPKAIEHTTNEIDALSDDFAAKGYTRLSLGAQ